MGAEAPVAEPAVEPEAPVAEQEAPATDPEAPQTEETAPQTEETAGEEAATEEVPETTEEPAADEELAGPLRVDEASEECDHTIARRSSADVGRPSLFKCLYCWMCRRV